MKAIVIKVLSGECTVGTVWWEQAGGIYCGDRVLGPAVVGPPGGDHVLWRVWFERVEIWRDSWTIQAEQVSVGAGRAGCKRVLKMKPAGGAMEREPASSLAAGGIGL